MVFDAQLVFKSFAFHFKISVDVTYLFPPWLPIVCSIRRCASAWLS